MRSETKVFNTLVSATFDAYVDKGKASVNMLTSYPLVDALWKNGRTETKNGGLQIVGNARYGFNPNTQWYSGNDPLNTDTFEVDTTFAYDWKNLHAPVTYLGTDKRRNMGEAQQIDMVTEMLDSTMLTINKVVDIAMAGNGTGDNGKVILGLEAFFPTTPTTDPAVGAIGGLTASGHTWWQNYAVTSFGSFAANGPGGTAADQWLNAWNSISDGNDQPDLVISDQLPFEYYARANLNAVQLVMNGTRGATGDRTFSSLTYMGKPWFWSRNVAAGRAYFLRTGDLRFLVHPQGNMTLSEFERVPGYDKYTASVLLQCIFMTTRRMFSAVIDGITA